MSAISTPATLSSPPAAGQLVEHEGKSYDTIREGRAYILIPPNTRTSVEPKVGGTGKKRGNGDAKSTGKTQNLEHALRLMGTSIHELSKIRSFTDSRPRAEDKEELPQNVFYNPIQQFNRDLSVVAIKAFGEDWLRRRKGKSGRHRERKKQNSKKRSIDEVSGTATIEGSENVIKKVKSVGNQGSGDDGGVQLDNANSTIEILEGTDRVPKENEEIQKENATTTSAESSPHEKKDQPRFRILDALSATGLRALRYAKEIPFVTAVTANDMNPNAIKSMALNIEHNGVTSKIDTNIGDAIGHMYNVAFPPTQPPDTHKIHHKYDVIDLDPYGTAAPFIDAALQALNDGGLLCVTCTDSGVFASTGYSEKTYALYGGMPVKGPSMHEGGLRLIINSVATSAARYGLAIEPLLSLSVDYYIRIFIRVRKSPADVKFLAGKTMLMYMCDAGCSAWTSQFLTRNLRQAGKTGNTWFKYTIGQGPTSDRLCEHCRSKMHVAGPMWGGPLHNQAFVEKILADVQGADPEIYETIPRIEGMLNTALEELSVNESVTHYDPSKMEVDETTEMIPPVPPELTDHHPFFINPSVLSKVIHCVAPSDAAMKGALRRAGYRATRSHCQPGSIKTDAPWEAIWEIMREWVRQKHPIKEGSLKTGTAGWHIMQAARQQPDEGKEKTEDDKSDEQKDEGESPEIITDSNNDDNDGRPTMPEMKPPDSVKTMRVVFDEVLGKDRPAAGGKRLVRYQQNPRENWGPMSRAK